MTTTPPPSEHPEDADHQEPAAAEGWSPSSADGLLLASAPTVPAEDGAQSIRRTISVLQAVAHGRLRGLRLTEISDITGIARPTVHRLLNVLTAEGLTKRSTSSGRYYIGPQVSLLALARPALPALLRCVEGPLADISTRFGETAFFSIRSGLDSICVARSLGRFPIQVLAIEEGDRRPLSAITSGIAMLAALPEATATRILSWDRRRAEAMGIDLKLTSERLAEARERGFVLRDGGVPPGTKAVAVSLTTSQHIPFAAISVAGTNARMDHERCLEIAAYVREKADALAAILKPPSAQTPLTPD